MIAYILNPTPETQKMPLSCPSMAEITFLNVVNKSSLSGPHFPLGQWFIKIRRRGKTRVHLFLLTVSCLTAKCLFKHANWQLYTTLRINTFTYDRSRPSFKIYTLWEQSVQGLELPTCFAITAWVSLSHKGKASPYLHQAKSSYFNIYMYQVFTMET